MIKHKARETTMTLIDDKLAKAKLRLEKAKGTLSESDRKEIEQREQLAKIEAEIAEENRKARELKLDRQLDDAKTALGENAGLVALAIEGMPDTFIVRRNSKAHARWVDEMAKAVANKGDRAKVNRDYAVAVVYAWNDDIGNDDDPEFTLRLAKYLTENPGIVTPLNNTAADLAGVFATERKS